MNNGFYLSPNGLHIIEIYVVADSHVCLSVDLFYLDKNSEHCRLACDGGGEWLSRFLENWEFLA